MNVKMTWQIELRTDLLLSLNDDSLSLLELSGCRQINLGIEKTSSSALKSLGKTSIIAGLKEKNKHIVESTQIKLTATFILGGINEDEFSTKQLITDSKELSLSQAHYNPLCVYPSTILYKKCGFQVRDWYNLVQKDSILLGEIIFENKMLSCEKLFCLLEIAYDEFYGKSNDSQINPYTNRFNVRGQCVENL